MNYRNCLDEIKELTVKEGDRVEIIIKSALYCNVNENPIYHTGTILDFHFQEFKDGTYPVGMYMKFEKDALYDSEEEELVYFEGVEDVFPIKYEILGFAELNVGMVLSIKGTEVGKIIRFDYINGSLIPATIKEGSSGNERKVTEGDKEFIRELLNYGTAQYFSHYVLSKSVSSN